MAQPQERVVGVPQLIWGLVKLVFFAAILATPLAGAWLSSSLAAYFNGAPRTCLLVSLLLFPVLPLAWESIAAARATKARTSRFIDRLVLRTLFLNVVFLGVLLWHWPAQSAVALSTRGDWFLDGKSGPAVETLRGILFSTARGLEWLQHTAQPNPFPRKASDGKPVVPDAQPVPKPKPVENQVPTPTPMAPTALWPQPAELHHAVRDIPHEDEVSIESVGKYLAAHSSGTLDRLKALHDYVADRIAYDAPALLLPHVPDEDADPEPVFQRKLGVCAGYARLLRALGAVTGDQIEYVSGDARTSMGPAPSYGNGHAWNAVFVDGKWLLVDATWDAGALSAAGTFDKHYRSDWLFTPPEVFGITHQPEDSAWQLRSPAIDVGAFLRQPLLDPSFFLDGLRLVDPDRSQVTVHGAFEAHVQRRDGVFLMADARPLAGGKEQRCSATGTDTLEVHCVLPPGEYQVILFDSTHEDGDYASVGRFGVNVSP